MKTLVRSALVVAFGLSLAAPAFAKGGGKGTPQTHHCMKDGAEQKMTKKECVKAGGTWEKGAPAEAAPAADGAAPTPAPTPAPAK